VDQDRLLRAFERQSSRQCVDSDVGGVFRKVTRVQTFVPEMYEIIGLRS